MPVSEPYYDDLNPDLLRLIPPDAKVVLEIGCGAGKLCEAYRMINPGVEWLGVEANEMAARAAIGRGLKVRPIRVEQFILSRVPAQHEFDCLILGDILEHLESPWDILAALADYLHPGAQVLASIPNVGHWTVIRDLLAGKWDYTDDGLLDRTHLRFFTRTSIKAMFEAAGLHVFQMVGRDICNDGFEDWCHANKFIDQMWSKEWQAFQYIVRAVKPIPIGVAIGVPYEFSNGVSIPLHIHAITAEECCARPRIREPFAMLETIPGAKCTAGGFPSVSNIADKILIRQRNYLITPDELRKFIADGWLIVQECDDYPLAYQNGKERDWIVFRGCHAIQVATETIADTIRQFNPNVFVFPNQVARLEPFPAEKERDAIRVFCGWQNRHADWKPIVEAINRVHFDHVRTSWPPLHFHVVHDMEFYKSLKVAHRFFHDFLPYNEYRALLRTCDIALLPLEDTEFNRHKSDLKFLECAAEGTACLAGYTVYGAAREDMTYAGKPLCIYADAMDFCADLDRLIREPDERHARAIAAYAYVRDNRMLGQHYRKLYDWYLHLINSRQALHDGLLARCPELR